MSFFTRRDNRRGAATKKEFQTNRELKEAVKKYTGRSFHPTMRDVGTSTVMSDDDDDAQHNNNNKNKTENEEQEFHSRISGHCCNPDEAEEFATTYGWPIGRWDVSNVKDFASIFHGARTFNDDICAWDVSNATNLGWMFHNAQAFNRDIASWNTANVTTIHYMFNGAGAFDQVVSSWNTAQVTDL
jgi:surface protein